MNLYHDDVENVCRVPEGRSTEVYLDTWFRGLRVRIVFHEEAGSTIKEDKWKEKIYKMEMQST